MQTLSTALRAALYKGVSLRATTRLIAEWNQNRYAGIATVDNAAGVEDYDAEIFPIESIVSPDRPNQGLLKMRLSKTGTVPEGYITAGYTDAPTTTRYYLAGVDDIYKYWVSPGESAATGTATLANTQPYFVYSNLAWSNKIVVKFDTSITYPTKMTVQTTVDGTTWTTVATNPIVGADGRVVLYRQADNSWNTTIYRDNPVQLLGLRINVTELSRNGVSMSLIESSLRLESDLSYFVIDQSVTNTMSERSFVLPMGDISANEATVTLSNVDSRFDNSEPTTLYKGLIDKNVKFTCDLGYDTTAFGGSGIEYVRHFTMRTDVWSGQDTESVSVALTDQSAILQERKPTQTFYESMTVGEIVWRLCDSVGFTSYQYSGSDVNTSSQIPYWWTDGSQTVWELFNDLATATQTAIYFDEFGILQVKSREAAYNLTRPLDWTFDATTVSSGMVTAQSRPTNESGKLADIIESATNYDYESNQVNVKYQTTSISDYANGYPVMESVWEPEGDTVLRASPLVSSLTSAGTSFKINTSDVRVWPYEGIVNIEGELIRYSGKLYSYYLANGTVALKTIKSNDEKVALDKLNPARAFQNHFTGTLGVVERGLWNTTARTHNVDASGYTTRYRKSTGPVVTWTGGFVPRPTESLLSLRANKTFTSDSYYVATRGATGDAPAVYAGTRLRFPGSGYSFGAAGLAVGVDSNDSGFFIEVVRTARVNRKYYNEIHMYKRSPGGVGTSYGKGAVFAVGLNQWIDLDVKVAVSGSNRIFTIMVNGTVKFSVTVPGSDLISNPMSGRTGVFVRGFSWADFEYLYSSTGAGLSGQDPFDGGNFFNRIEGGYVSNQLLHEWTYDIRTRTRVVKKKKTSYQQRYNSLLIDEFGPVVHEVREFDVDFSKTPVVHSRLYWSNESQVVAPEYVATPFGAKFILCNASRDNAIVSGEDTLMFGVDNPVTQQFMIYGRVVTQAEAETVTVKDDLAIKRRGLTEVDIDSTWIQSKAAATALGTWITGNWAGGCDEVSLTVMGNPAIQLGDLVAVNYPAINMDRSTHKYFVVGVEQSYDGGLETVLTLRRAKV